MNAIKQMYKEYGVEPRLSFPCGIKRIEKYPPFTAQKQIELIKLIQDTDDIDCFYHHRRMVNLSEFKQVMCVEFIKEFAHEKALIIRTMQDTWEETLAALITVLKPHIDNSKVKEILEK